jgi:uncharacterized protein (TIGR02145 family)
MKQHLLLILLIGANFVHITAQTTITLTFTAEVNGNHQPLDSILIQNLTQGGDTTLHPPDTVLVLNHGIGIDDRLPEHRNGMILYPAYPNPVIHTSTIRLWLPQDAPVTLRLYDLVGRELATLSRTLGEGEHSFTFTPGRETYYLLVAEAVGQSQVQKIINLSPGEGNCRLSYAGHQPTAPGMRKGKFTFPWVPGDSMKFVGYASVGVDTIEDQPVQSAFYTFLFQTMGLPCPGMPIVTDYNGNVYNTVQIGNQCWMKENLQARHYRNGTSIPEKVDFNTWQTWDSGARCWYNNDSASYAATYGSLYNWFAVNDTNGLCPAGWHVASDPDWTILTGFLGGIALAGGPLKEAGKVHWSHPNTGATNSSGFTALPGGNRFGGSFHYIGGWGSWWSSTALDPVSAWHRRLSAASVSVVRTNDNKGHGYSVRCMRD